MTLVIMQPELEPVENILVVSALYFATVYFIILARPWLSPPASWERPLAVLTSQQLLSFLVEGKMVMNPLDSERLLYLVDEEYCSPVPPHG